jgi:membrane-associated phospholipid phosphatase
MEIEKKIAEVLSYIAHPLFIPLLGLVVISNSGTYAADLDPRFTHFIYLAVFIFTLLLPAGLIPLFYYSGMVRNIQLSERRERLIPMYITLVFYVAAYLLIRKLPVSMVYQRYLFAGCLSILLLLAVSYFWKISAHLMGWGGLVSLIVCLSLRFNTDLMLFLIFSIFMTGCVGSARLRLDAHNPLQVFAGFLLGFLTVFTAFAF